MFILTCACYKLASNYVCHSQILQLQPWEMSKRVELSLEKVAQTAVCCLSNLICSETLSLTIQGIPSHKQQLQTDSQTVRVFLLNF